MASNALKQNHFLRKNTKIRKKWKIQNFSCKFFSSQNTKYRNHTPTQSLWFILRIPTNSSKLITLWYPAENNPQILYLSRIKNESTTFYLRITYVLPPTYLPLSYLFSSCHLSQKKLFPSSHTANKKKRLAFSSLFFPCGVYRNRTDYLVTASHAL